MAARDAAILPPMDAPRDRRRVDGLPDRQQLRDTPESLDSTKIRRLRDDDQLLDANRREAVPLVAIYRQPVRCAERP